MQLKKPIANRGYRQALTEIGEILEKVEESKKPMSFFEKITATLSISLLVMLLGSILFACFALVWEAWTIDAPSTEEQIRWDLLDNEHDRNMHDPTRPPDSIVEEGRLKMLLLEENDRD